MESNQKKRLFEEFPPISTQEWESVIEADLKGADYEKRLVWKTDEGLSVRPYYREEDIENLNYLRQNPDAYPFVRGNKGVENNWQIVQEIREEDLQKANKIALKAFGRGAEAIAFNAFNVNEVEDLEVLLANICLQENPIRFHNATSYTQLFEVISAYVEKKKLDVTKLDIQFDRDPIHYVLQNNKFPTSKADVMQRVLNVAISDLVQKSKIRTISVNAKTMHNAGAHIVQEMAYALAWGNEYLAFAAEKGVEVDKIAPKMEFQFGVGSNYFLEIAKFRAVRMLWAKIVKQYNPQNEESTKMRLHAVSSLWNKSIYDANVNMLRLTTEGMSAAVAGCDSIMLNPYDINYKKENEFSSRIARNVQLLLKHESYFDKVVDPSAGSYYIENLTDMLASSAWSLFQIIEAEGGFIANVENLSIKAAIEATAVQRAIDVATRKTVMVGTNQYPNANEFMLNEIEDIKEEEYDGLNASRRSEGFENLRLSTEKFVENGGSRPVVFLLTIGNLAMRKARAGFATNFFGCAGYEIVDNNGFETAQEGVAEAMAKNADIVVVCSSDDEYEQVVPQVKEELNKQKLNAITVVAGYPKELLDSFKAIGVENYIHVRSNVLEELKKYNNLLNIEKQN
ncbi:MAG: methylmalonyl-CoA mutase small subunit [Bacteroidales bacterium]|jgi:methylmalonyl-CoA mutase|nr:methylmalonyl-CoA mutase small subunit [Bacteroidales bacterium]